MGVSAQAGDTQLDGHDNGSSKREGRDAKAGQSHLAFSLRPGLPTAWNWITPVGQFSGALN